MRRRIREECECRLCAAPQAVGGEFATHLKERHGYTDKRIGEIVGSLVASKDGSDWYENTFQWREGETLVAVSVQRGERADDDPMRDEMPWDLP